MKKPIIILLSGASCSGKTTLAKKLVISLKKKRLPFLHQEADRVAEEIKSYNLNVLTKKIVEPLSKGNNIIIDGLLPYGNPEKLKNILKILNRYHLIFVGVHCELDELRKRASKRKNRQVKWVEKQFHDLHKGIKYDLEIDKSKESINKNVNLIISFVEKVSNS